MVDLTSPFCEKTFKHKSSLSRHKVKHTLGTSKIVAKFNCNICLKKFTQVNNYTCFPSLCTLTNPENEHAPTSKDL